MSIQLELNPPSWEKKKTMFSIHVYNRRSQKFSPSGDIQYKSHSYDILKGRKIIIIK